MPTTNHPTTTTTTDSDDPAWLQETLNGGSLRRVDPDTGSNGWASPPSHLFHLRSRHYFTNKTKSPSAPYLLRPAAVDWLRSASKLDHVLSRADNRIIHALRTHYNNSNKHKTINNNNISISRQKCCFTSKPFIVAVNLQVPGRDHHSAVFYFASDGPVPPGSALHRFINGDDAYRNERFKMVNRIVKGPWIVKAAVGGHSACLLGKALNCYYYKGPDYLEIDVDIGSSKIATAILHLALGCVTAVTIDMGFVVEAKEEEELPERLFGAVRICQMEMSSATYVDTPAGVGVSGKLTGVGGHGNRVMDSEESQDEVESGKVGNVGN